MRLPDTAHTGRRWRIHEFAGDFHLEDVWAIRTPGAEPDDFTTALDAMLTRDLEEPRVLRFLLAVRRKLGALFGWDERGHGNLRDRVPPDLRATTAPAGLGAFTPVYRTDDECALELANRTVHAVMHLGWVPAEQELRMAVLVKPNGLLGRLYLAAITPFRHLLVLPAFTRRWERAWLAAASPLPGAHYADSFSQAIDVEATPEHWARALFGDVPSPGGRLIWRGFLGLRLSRGASPETVAGWRIAERGPDRIRLETRSWFLTANLVVEVKPGRLTLNTYLRYDRRLGHLVWPPLSAVHRRLAPGLLRGAKP